VHAGYRLPLLNIEIALDLTQHRGIDTAAFLELVDGLTLSFEHGVNNLAVLSQFLMAGL
jgi:hypothetical protein